MKIAIASDRVYPYFKSGAEKRYWDIAQALTHDGHEVHFFTGQWPGMQKHEVIDGIYLHGVYTIKNYYINSAHPIGDSIAYAINLIPYLATFDYDILDCDQFPLTHIIPASIITSIRNKKMFVAWHEVWRDVFYIHIGKLGKLGMFYEWLTVHTAPRLITASDITAQRLENELAVSKDKIIPLGSFIRLNEIDSVAPSTLQSDIVFVGRLMPHKNVQTILQTVAILKKNGQPTIKALIVGTGPEQKKLHKLAAELNVESNVTFIENAEKHKDVFAIMKSAKVLVHPSTREGFGMTVAESYACGTPVITIDHRDNAARFLINQGKTGYLTHHDPEEIAEKVKYIVENPTHREELSKNAREYVRQFDWNTVKEKLYQAYFS